MKSFKLSEYITLKSLGLIEGGSLLFSLAMNLLIMPMSLCSGGFLGVAQLLREVLLVLGIQVENVQKDGIIESYHRGSGFRPSENNMNFLDTEKGQTVLTTIQNFAKEVFAIDYLPARSSVAYYLFGEYDSDAKFHHGVDMDIGEGAKIHAFWGGKILAKGGDYGCVMIYVPELEVTTIYLHMKNIPDSFTVNQTIPAGTIIGEQSNVSRYNIASHLHFEVCPKEVYSAGNNFVSSASTALTSLIPYGYMRK